MTDRRDSIAKIRIMAHVENMAVTENEVLAIESQIQQLNNRRLGLLDQHVAAMAEIQEEVAVLRDKMPEELTERQTQYVEKALKFDVDTYIKARAPKAKGS